MKTVAQSIEASLKLFNNEIVNLHDDVTVIQLSKEKWSLKQVVGHLIDHASNTHQLLIRLQNHSSVDFPDYNRDQWVDTHNYNTIEFKVLTNLFISYNQLLALTIATVKENSLTHTWKYENRELTLKDILTDYSDHLATHIEHFQHRKRETIENFDSFSTL